MWNDTNDWENSHEENSENESYTFVTGLGFGLACVRKRIENEIEEEENAISYRRRRKRRRGEEETEEGYDVKKRKYEMCNEEKGRSLKC